MQPCPDLVRLGITLEQMLTNNNTYRGQLNPHVSLVLSDSVAPKRSMECGHNYVGQMGFEFNLKSSNCSGKQVCDQIDFFTHHSLKHQMDIIEGINVYLHGELTVSYGTTTNTWCVKKVMLGKNITIESVCVKSRKVIEKIEFRLVDNASNLKLVEIGSDNDQKYVKIDAKNRSVYGFYGSFVSLIDNLYALNTFGLVLQGALINFLINILGPIN